MRHLKATRKPRPVDLADAAACCDGQSSSSIALKDDGAHDASSGCRVRVSKCVRVCVYDFYRTTYTDSKNPKKFTYDYCSCSDAELDSACIYGWRHNTTSWS